jgi:hypothetical protein
MQCIPWYAKAEVWSAIASGVSAVVAVGALIGLYFYVIYTKSMMASNVAIMRATIEPILVVERAVDDLGYLWFRVSNAGNGPALNTISWALYETSEVATFGTFRKRFEEPAHPIGLIRANGKHDEGPVFSVKRPEDKTPVLILVEGRDSADGIHQVNCDT